MRASHASAKYRTAAPPLPKSVKKEKWENGLMVKGRNEPATISHVAHVIASVKAISIEEVCDAYVSCLIINVPPYTNRLPQSMEQLSQDVRAW